MTRVWCKYCVYYPERNRHVGSGNCIDTVSTRSTDSRACQPRLTVAGKLRRMVGMRIG
ncbi:MAG: hypothetical protein PF636_12360 [Actinomycetota bacterium]|nr:hypothetical protein [Actinomycetota bacterium]